MLQTSIHPPNQPPPPIPGKRHFFYRLLRVCSTMLCVHLLLRTFQCYGSHLGICWSAGTLSIPVHWGHPQHVETHLACSMGTLIAPLTIDPLLVSQEHQSYWVSCQSGKESWRELLSRWELRAHEALPKWRLGGMYHAKQYHNDLDCLLWFRRSSIMLYCNETFTVPSFIPSLWAPL